jgi:hypothetical protein
MIVSSELSEIWKEKSLNLVTVSMGTEGSQKRLWGKIKMIMKSTAVLERLWLQLTDWVTPKYFDFPLSEFKLRTWYVSVDFIYIITNLRTL